MSVTGPYRDARDPRRPWAVTVRVGVSVQTTRFEHREAALAHARANKPKPVRRPRRKAVP